MIYKPSFNLNPPIYVGNPHSINEGAREEKGLYKRIESFHGPYNEGKKKDYADALPDGLGLGRYFRKI